MRTTLGVALLLVASSTALGGFQQPMPRSFGPFRIGPSRRIGEMRFEPSGFIYNLFGDHCEVHQNKFLCLFTFEQHQGSVREWPAKASWVENYAIDQFGEKHYKTSAFFLSTRGTQQDAATLGPGDKVFLVQEFEGVDKAISRLTIVSPHGQIRDLPIE